MSTSVEAIWSQLQKQRPALKTADLRDVPGLNRTVRDISQAAKPERSSAAETLRDLVPVTGFQAGQAEDGTAGLSADLLVRSLQFLSQQLCSP